MSGGGELHPSDVGFNEFLGDHLRRIRRQKGLSLLDVEAASAKEFKASVLGAYERGERAISAARLARLAGVYRLPLRAMIPHDGSPAGDAGGGVVGITVDVSRAESSDAPEARAVARYVKEVQAMRQSWTQGPIVGVRSSDVRALAAALDRSPEDFLRRLDELGVKVS